MARGGRASYGGLILVINSSVAPGVVPLVYGLGSEWFPPHLSPYILTTDMRRYPVRWWFVISRARFTVHKVKAYKVGGGVPNTRERARQPASRRELLFAFCYCFVFLSL